MAPISRLVQLCGLLVAFVGTVQSQECFWPNGTNRNDAYDLIGQGIRPYRACGGATKMCCRIGDGGGDTCDQAGTGLCIGSEGTWWRESCTDQTWQDPGCVILFNQGFYPAGNVQLNGTDAPMTNCSDGTFCLGGHNKTCCGTKDAIKPVNGRVVDSATLHTPTATASSQTASATATSPSSGTSDASGVGQSGGSSNAGAIAGGVVGGIALIALVAGAIWFFRKRRSRRTDGQVGVVEQRDSLIKYGGPAPPYGNGPAQTTWSHYSPNKDSGRVYEAGGNGINEMSGDGNMRQNVRTHELA